MRQEPMLAHQFKLIFPYFAIIVLDVMSLWIVLPVLATLVSHTADNILTAHGSHERWRHLIYGIILSIPAFFQIIVAPLLGYISDHVGRKKVLLYCAVGAFISFIIYAISFALSSLFLLILARVINGVSSGSLAVAQAAMTDISDGKRRAVNIALIAVAMTIGLILGPLLGGVLSDQHLVSWFNNALPFYAAAILSLICIIAMWLYLQETTLAPTQQKNNAYALYSGIKMLLNHSYVLLVLLAFLFFELGWSLYFQAIPLLLVPSFHYSNTMLGIFINYVSIILSLGLFFILRLAINHFSLAAIIIAGLIVNILAYTGIYFLHQALWQWLLAIPVALAVAICYPALKAAASNAFPQAKQGLLMGIAYAFLCLAFGVSGILSGWLSYRNIHLPFQISALFCCISLFIFIMVTVGRKSLVNRSKIEE